MPPGSQHDDLISSTLSLSSACAQTPPPDDPSHVSAAASTSHGGATRAWFPAGAQQGGAASYQSGGIPTFNTSQAGGLGAVEDAEAENGTSMWETRHGLRVDMLAAFAYVLGPVSGAYSDVSSCHDRLIHASQP